MYRKERLSTISQTLSMFSNQDLKTACIDFLQVLGYSASTTTSLSSPDQEGFDQFAKRSPYYAKFNKESALFKQWNEVHLLFQLTDDDIRYTNQISLFQPEFRHDLYDSYLFFAIDLGNEKKAKYKLAKITREINKLLPMPVLVIYKTGQSISLAIINRRYNLKDKDMHVLEKVTTINDIDISGSPHRAHLEILSEMSLSGLLESGHEVNSFLALHKAWSQVLNTEELNRRFYKNVREWFYSAREKVVFPINGNNSEPARTENLIRLLTRMIFIWFIKEKELIDNRLFDLDLLQRDYFNPSCEEHSIYYKAILQNLFFATLNNEMNKDKPEFQRQFMPDQRGFIQGHLNQYYYRYRRMFRDVDEALLLFEDTPFLNGGLFECQDDQETKERRDYFTNPVENKDMLYVPDELFFSPNTKGEPTGLIDIFKHYKFTITENTPIEEEIALDPELLGKVFESLLTEWDNDYSEAKKKHTGSYYTPREIVDYMVNGTLVTYLESICEKQGLTPEDRIKDLLDYSSLVPEFSDTERKLLIQALSTVKVLDPACGSGAFPMGMLHKIVFVLGKLDPANKLFKDEQIQIAHESIKLDIEQASKINDNEARKSAEDILIKRLERLEEIFGDDYEVDYARKLFIIENCIFGVDIQPIAMQIAKLRFFISLIVEQEKHENKPNFGLIPLPNLETKMIAANSLIPQTRRIKNEIFFSEIEALECKLLEVRKKHFYAKSNKEKKDLKKQDKTIRNSMYKIVKSYYGNSVPADILTMIEWDPYNTSKCAPFFDPFWMFGLSNNTDESTYDKRDKEPSYNKVFDIIIGNPPYVRADNPAIKDQRDQIKALEYYETIWEKWDLYIPFLERSYKLLKPKGVFSYIISDAYIASKYAQKSHAYFATYSRINRIDFLSDLKVFDAAVRNVIIQIQNDVGLYSTPLRLVHKNTFGNREELPLEYPSNIDSEIFKPYTTNVLGSIFNTLTWGEICYVSYGLRPSSDERYYKGEFKKEHLISDFQDQTHPLPYIEGKWITRYKVELIKYLEWGTERSPRKLVRPTFPELYLPPKIMLGGMTGAVYDESNLVCNHSITVSVLWKDLKDVFNKSISSSIQKDFKPSEHIAVFRDKLERNSEKFELKYLLAILNSSYAKYFQKTVQRSQIGVYPDDIKKIPIPAVDKGVQSIYATLVDYITFLKKCEKPIHAYVDNEFMAKEFDRMLDAMVLELYFRKEMKAADISLLEAIDGDFPPIVHIDNQDEIEKVITRSFHTIKSSGNALRSNLMLLDVRLENVIKKIRGIG